MIPVPPISVKFNEDERAEIKALASSLGWTESKFIRDSVRYIIYLIHHPGSTEEPEIVSLARLVICHKTDPASLQEHVKKVHLAQGSLAAKCHSLSTT